MRIIRLQNSFPNIDSTKVNLVIGKMRGSQIVSNFQLIKNSISKIRSQLFETNECKRQTMARLENFLIPVVGRTG